MRPDVSDPDALYTLRHDLANPLAALLAETQLLLMEPEKLNEETLTSLREIEKLAMSGIDAEMAGRIAQQFATHGERGSVWLANTQSWTDGYAIAPDRRVCSRTVCSSGPCRIRRIEHEPDRVIDRWLADPREGYSLGDGTAGYGQSLLP